MIFIFLHSLVTLFYGIIFCRKNILVSFFFFYQGFKLLLSLRHLSKIILLLDLDTVVKANLYLLAGNTLLFLISYFIIFKKKVSFSFLRDKIHPYRLKPIFFLAFFVIFFGLWCIIFNTTYFLKNDDFLTWKQSINPVYNQIFFMLQMSVVTLGWIFWKSKNYFFLILFSLFIFIFTAYLGSRTIPAFLLALFFADFLENASFKKGVFLKTTGILVVLSFLTFSSNVLFRMTKNVHALFENINKNKPPIKKTIEVVQNITLGETKYGETRIISNFYHVFHLDYKHSPYREGSTLKRILLAPIPTKYSFDLKPENMIHVYAKDILKYLDEERRNHRNNKAIKKTAPLRSSILPTFWGDAYANHGFMGFVFYAVLLSFYFLLLTKIQNSLSGYAKIAFSGIAIVYILMMSRGSVYVAFLDTMRSLVILTPLSLIDIYLLKAKKNGQRTCI